MQTMSQQAVKVKSNVADVLRQQYYERIERDPRVQRLLQLLDEKFGPVGRPPVRQRPVLRLIQGGLV